MESLKGLKGVRNNVFQFPVGREWLSSVPG
jgi:hypothetical protein